MGLQLSQCYHIQLTMTETSTTAKYKNISPAKKLRNTKRLMKFIVGKMLKKTFPRISVCYQETISISPEKPKLSFSKQAPVSIKPNRCHLSHSTLNPISIALVPQRHDSSH